LERLRGEFHLGEFVHDRDVVLAGLLQRGDGQALERGEVDAVARDARWAGKLDMGEHTPLAAEALDREAQPAAAFADLLGDETAHCDPVREERVGNAARDRALARPESSVQQILVALIREEHP
jgi:hypothetical protein